MNIGDKVAHVKSARQSRNHECHWPGCGKQVPPALWGCATHWYALPRSLRDQIWRAYVPGQEANGRPSSAYVDAARAVQAWIQENAPRLEAKVCETAEENEHKELNERRRDGYSEIFDRIKTANPGWKCERIAAAAKAEWSQRRSSK